MADSRSRFLSVFPRIVEEMTGVLVKEGMPEDAVQWYRRSLEYNTPGGKLNRGISVVDTVQILQGKSSLNDKEYERAAILGWCVELLQAYFLVADDMMDQSITRRGQPCWYRVEGVENIAINDAFMLEAAIYHLLKVHFRDDPAYGYLLELFHDTTFQTEMGQLIDLISAPENHVDLNKFSLRKHHLIVVYKTAFYSFYLPVALGMRLVGIKDETQYKQALDILLILGEYFQVQDDYLDCYGDPSVIGKIGTDILDNKCSWNVNIAIENATAEQRAVLDQHYGRKDASSEAKVKEVFSASNIDVAGRFKKYEQQSYEELTALISKIDESKGLKQEVFTSFLQKVYKRTK
jgi:farnesyl diphosphate synthase